METRNNNVCCFGQENGWLGFMDENDIFDNIFDYVNVLSIETF